MIDLRSRDPRAVSISPLLYSRVEWRIADRHLSDDARFPRIRRGFTEQHRVLQLLVTERKVTGIHRVPVAIHRSVGVG